MQKRIAQIREQWANEPIGANRYYQADWFAWSYTHLTRDRPGGHSRQKPWVWWHSKHERRAERERLRQATRKALEAHYADLWAETQEAEREALLDAYEAWQAEQEREEARWAVLDAYYQDCTSYWVEDLGWVITHPEGKTPVDYGWVP